jgi:hypothetical protein
MVLSVDEQILNSNCLHNQQSEIVISFILLKLLRIALLQGEVAVEIFFRC